MSRSQAVDDFNNYLETATSQMRYETKQNAILQMIKLISKGSIEPEEAVEAIYGKIIAEDPLTIYFAIEVLEAVFNKCGNIVHKVICSVECMDFLKVIIESSKHENIKEKIIAMLQDWAQKFKYFPRYSAPKELLDSLQNGKHQTLENSSEISHNLNLKDVKEENLLNKYEYEQALEEYRKRHKQRHKMYLKSQNLPTSDEDDDNKLEVTDTNNSNKKEEKVEDSKISKKLPKELQQLKENRHFLNAVVQEVRAEKHNNFIQTGNQENSELKKCQAKDCTMCTKKPKNENEPISSRLPLCMRKVKESKAIMQKGFDQYKEDKKKNYYGSHVTLSSNCEHHKSEEHKFHEVLPEKEMQKSMILEEEIEEERQLAKALRLSQLEMNAGSSEKIFHEVLSDKEMQKSMILEEEIEEERQLAKALRLSQLEMNAGSSENKFQEVLSKKEMQNPKISEERQLAEALRLSQLEINAGSSGINKTTPKLLDAFQEKKFREVLPKKEMQNPTTSEEERQLAEALRLSQLEMNADSSKKKFQEFSLEKKMLRKTSLQREYEGLLLDDNEALQKALDLSFAEVENKDFNHMPDDLIKEEILLNYAAELSLVESALENNEDLRVCIACCEKKNLKAFMPCNHSCFCSDCSKSYNQKHCPICRKNYTAIA